MKTNKRVRQNMILMITLVLIFSLILGITATSISASSSENIINAADITASDSNLVGNGATVSGMTVNMDGKSDSGSSGNDQWSYFPTKNLEAQVGNKYDLSGLWQSSITDVTNNYNAIRYNKTPGNRLFGLERKNYVRAIPNNKFSSTEYSSIGGWSENDKGKGLYFRNNGQGTGKMFAAYFSVKIPDSEVGKEHILKYSIDSYTYINGTTDRLDAAVAVFEDTRNSGAVKMTWNGTSKENNGVGLNHKDGDNDWVIPGATDYSAKVSDKVMYGTKRISDTSLISHTCNGSGWKSAGRDYNSDGIKLSSEARYVRFVILMEINSTNSGLPTEMSINNINVGLYNYNYKLESMGAKNNGGTLKYDTNNHRGNGKYTSEESTGGDKWSYFPSQYLVPNVYNSSISLDGMLKQIVSGNSSYYPGNVDNRLFGIERSAGKYDIKTVDAQCFDCANTTWPTNGSYSDTTNGNTLGDGLSIHLNSSSRTSIALYFSMALPDHLVPQDENIELNWSFNTKTFGESWYKRFTGDIYHYLSAGYAVYADTNAGVCAPIQNPTDRASGNSIGFNHNQTWSIQSKGNVGFNVKPDEGSGLKVVGSNTIFADYFQNRTLDKAVNVTLPIPKGTKFLRFIVAFDQDGISDVSKIKYALTNMKVSINNTKSINNPASNIKLADTVNTQVTSRKVDFSINPSAYVPYDSIANDVRIHYNDPFNADAETSIDLATLKANNSKDVVWVDNADLGVTKYTTDKAGNTVENKNVKGTGVNMRINTKAKNIWVTYKGNEVGRLSNIEHIDNDKPQISITKDKGKITVNVTDDSHPVTIKLSGNNIEEKQINTDKNGNYEFTVENNGDYSITATDSVGNSTETTTVTVDKIPPTISGVTQNYNASNNTVTISATIVDKNAGGLKSVKVGDNEMTPGDNNIYTIDVTANGNYTITATDNLNNVTTSTINVSGIDNVAPTIGDIVGNNDNEVAVDVKIISFTVTDTSDIGSVIVKYVNNGVEEDVIVNTENNYKNCTITATKSGTYKIYVSDKWNNNNTSAPKEFVVKHILTAGENVALSTIEGNPNGVNATFTIDNYNNRIIAPNVANATAVNMKYNYGKKANYDIVFGDLTNDVSTTISSATESISLNVTTKINGNQISSLQKTYGTDVIFNASGDAYVKYCNDKNLGEFIGWFNERGGLITTDVSMRITVKSNTVVNAKFRTDMAITNGVVATFENLSGQILDVQNIDSANVNAVVDSIIRHYNDPKDNTYNFAPKNAYMTFYDWRIVKDDKGEALRHVTFRPRYSTDKKFSVTINGDKAVNPLKESGKDTSLQDGQFYYNQKINLTGSANGWAIKNSDGTYEIISSGDTTFHILNNTNFVKVENIPAESKQNNVGIDSATTKVNTENDTLVISASIKQDISNIKEIGFIVVANSEYDIDNFVVGNSNNVTKILVGSLSSTNQFLVNLNASAYVGTKVRAYYIDIDGKEYYSDVIGIN